MSQHSWGHHSAAKRCMDCTVQKPFLGTVRGGRDGNSVESMGLIKCGSLKVVGFF